MRWPWSKHADELTDHRDRADRAVQRADDLLQRAEHTADRARVTARRAAAIRTENGFGQAVEAAFQTRRKGFPWSQS